VRLLLGWFCGVDDQFELGPHAERSSYFQTLTADDCAFASRFAFASAFASVLLLRSRISVFIAKREHRAVISNLHCIVAAEHKRGVADIRSLFELRMRDLQDKLYRQFRDERTSGRQTRTLELESGEE
jgi:hypothetical protein